MAASMQKTLVGWKAIAGYFGRDERTVMRWAASRGMPVQRVAGQAGSSVYAWPADLDAWLRQGEAPPRHDQEPAAIPLPPGDPSSLVAAPAADPVSSAPDLPVPDRPAGPPPFNRPMLLAVVAVVAAVALAAMVMIPSRLATVRTVPPAVGRAATFGDPAARASYLQASFDWNLRTRDSLQRAILEYGNAVARDPGVATAYVGLANSYLLLREYGAMPEAEAYARATVAAKVAVGLEPGSIEAKRALAFIAFWWRGDIAEARRQFTEAVALAPADPLTHHWFANALAANGELHAAYREIAAARTLDPTSVATLIDYGRISYMVGRRDEGRQVLRSLITADRRDAALYRTLREIALYEGRYADYLKSASMAAALRNDPAARAEIAAQAADFARGGAPLMLEKMVYAARNETRQHDTGFYHLAQVAALAGRRSAAIDALAPACADHADPASIGAPGDLSLSKAIGRATVEQLCGRGSLDGIGQDRR